MSTKFYSELIIDDGNPPLYGGLLVVPKDCVFWRGYAPKYPPVSDKPAFFGSKHTAKEYAKPELGCFTNKKELKLMDINFMKVILRQLLDEIKLKREYSVDKSIPSKDEIDCIDCLTISFGICSLAHPILLMNKMYKNIPHFQGLEAMKKYYNSMKYFEIEQSGFRVGETTVDAATMYFLRDFFKDYADGFFSPTLPSPFHVEKGGFLTPEIVIFNPKNSGIELLNAVPSIMDKLDISDLFFSNRRVVLIRNSKFATQFNIKGGTITNKSHSIDEFNSQIEMKNKKIVALSKLGAKYGKLWRDEYFYLHHAEPPKPTCRIPEILMMLEEKRREGIDKILKERQNNGE